MLGWHTAHAARASGLLGLACCAALLSCAMPAHAEPAGEPNVAGPMHRIFEPLEHFLVPRCLTPAVDGVFNDLVAGGAFQRVLGDGFTLERADARHDHIELEIQDRAHQSYVITLSLQSTGGTADGQGHRFMFYVAASSPPNPQARTALLAIASLLDEAIPETALQRCSGNQDGAPDARRGERRYPRAVALASAAAEVTVLAAAILFGLCAIRPPSGAGGSGRRPRSVLLRAGSK